MARLNAVLTRDEFYCPQAVAIIRLLMLTGCRLSEVVSLEWDWIRGKRIHLPDSKSGPRTVWLSSAARSPAARPRSSARRLARKNAAEKRACEGRRRGGPPESLHRYLTPVSRARRSRCAAWRPLMT